jgi:anti-sigma factor RsiW
MTGCKDIQRVLATYGDAKGEERTAADAHLATCRSCAAALAGYREVDALILAAPDRPLPARLARPFASLLREQDAQGRVGRELPAAGSFGRRLAPVAAILFILLAISALLWSLSSDGAPRVSTPTLTTTLTPATITARETGPAVVIAAAQRPLPAPNFVPTPAPAPAPRGNSATLFAGSPAHATITH